MSAPDTIRMLTTRLAGYRFRATDEHTFQGQISTALDGIGIKHECEVALGADRFDIVIRVADSMIVLELKVKGSAAAVERQAQRYLNNPEVDAVVIVSTSRRLIAGIAIGTMPGPARDGRSIRKPLAAIAARTF